MISFFRTIKFGIRNIYYFTKVIWNFRAWDYTYTNEVMIKCYEAIYHEQLTFKYNPSSPKSRHMLDLRIIINLLKRINEDNNMQLDFDKHDAKWGQVELNFGPTESKGFRTSVTSRANVNTDADEKQERKEYLKICKKERASRIQDLKQLGPHFVNMLHWWT